MHLLALKYTTKTSDYFPEYVINGLLFFVMTNCFEKAVVFTVIELQWIEKSVSCTAVFYIILKYG